LSVSKKNSLIFNEIQALYASKTNGHRKLLEPHNAPASAIIAAFPADARDGQNDDATSFSATLGSQWRKYAAAWSNPARARALAEAYRPIVRGFLLPGSAYYAFVSFGHWRDESGFSLALLGGSSVLTAIAYVMVRQFVLSGAPKSLLTLELSGLAANLLMYANVLIYMLVHFEQSKLIYFVLMAVVFSTSGVTLRVTLASIVLSIATLYWFAQALPPEIFHQYVFIGVAGSFASFGMATLLRRAILQQVEARLTADQLTEQAQLLAATDPLTGIANRRAMFDAVQKLVAQNKPFWLGVVDLDGFKAINDVYGHVLGDSLLCAVVQRLEEAQVAGIRYGRIGGDEFAVIIELPFDERQTEASANHLIAQISRPYELALLHLGVGASAGFAHFPSMAPSSAQLYEKADFALYKAKRNKRGHAVIFDTRENQELQENTSLERALREGDLEHELSLLFQPQMNLVQNRVTGFEALARWQSPTLGAVRPDKFIRAAERSGLIQKVTTILFDKLLTAMKTWPGDCSISFNLSGQDICDRDFTLSLLRRIIASGIDPKRIEFEITETAVMSDFQTACQLLRDLSQAGCKIALDDFGSGYSSFEYIDLLPLDKVKVDKSFVRKIAHNTTSREIVSGIITLCRNLHLQCVLEGVETEEELAMLRPLNPEIIQGYLFGRPMDEASARALVA